MKKRRYVIKPRMKFTIILLLFVYLAIIFTKQEIILRKQYKETCDLERRIEQVRKENSDLERQIQYSDSEDYIERMARKNLGWVKEGEKVFIEDKK